MNWSSRFLYWAEVSDHPFEKSPTGSSIRLYGLILLVVPSHSIPFHSIYLRDPRKCRRRCPFLHLLPLSFPTPPLFTPKPSFPRGKSPLPIPQKPFSIKFNSQLVPFPILSFSGDPVGETYLDLKSAPPSTARAVVHRAIITDLQNKRRGAASALTRAEVRGGGKKPYAQNKTGHARRGSQTTPLRPGGGVVFGPKPRDWSIKINRKEKQLAISTALSSAIQNMVVVEDFRDKFEKPKTREFTSAMRRWFDVPVNGGGG